MRVRSRVSIAELLSETASLLRASLPSSVELVVAGAPAGLAVFGEAAQLQQIIVNLCRNAAQAMGGSGRIDVSADTQELMTAASSAAENWSRALCSLHRQRCWSWFRTKK